MSIEDRTLVRSDEGSSDDDRGTERLSLPRPPKDFTLNKLLKDVADSMSQEDFDNIKFIFRGDDGFGKRVLEKMKSPLDLFTYMKEYRFISRDNIIYLQYILKELKKDELLLHAIQYAQTMDDTLYFYSPSSEPVNGYTHVHVHVAGKDLNNFNRTDLEELRTTLAKLLFLPPKFIVMDGIEEASSLLITILIPTQFADILRKLAIDKKWLAPLFSIGIDVIAIGKETFNVDSRTAVTDQIKVSTTYEQLQEKTRLLEERDNEVIKLTRKLREQKEMTEELKDKTTVKDREVLEFKDKMRKTKRDVDVERLKDNLLPKKTEIRVLTEDKHLKHHINVGDKDIVVQRPEYKTSTKASGPRVTQTMDVASKSGPERRQRFRLSDGMLERRAGKNKISRKMKLQDRPLQRVDEKELERQTFD